MSAAAAVVTVVCVCLIGHHRSRSDTKQYGGSLLHLTHLLRLPFYLVTEALKHHKSASSLVEAVVLLDAGVAAALGATSLQKSILLVYKTWTSEMPAAVDLRWPATACLGAPLVLSFLLAMGLLVHGVVWADHPPVSRKVMEHHSGAIAGLCLLSMILVPKKKKKKSGAPRTLDPRQGAQTLQGVQWSGCAGFFFSSAAAGCARHWGPLHTAEAHTDGRESEGAKGRAGPFIRARTLSGGEVALVRARAGGPRA